MRRSSIAASTFKQSNLDVPYTNDAIPRNCRAIGSSPNGRFIIFKTEYDVLRVYDTVHCEIMTLEVEQHSTIRYRLYENGINSDFLFVEDDHFVLTVSSNGCLILFLMQLRLERRKVCVRDATLLHEDHDPQLWTKFVPDCNNMLRFIVTTNAFLDFYNGFVMKIRILGSNRRIIPDPDQKESFPFIRRYVKRARFFVHQVLNGRYAYGLDRRGGLDLFHLVQFNMVNGQEKRIRLGGLRLHQNIPFTSTDKVNILRPTRFGCWSDKTFNMLFTTHHVEGNGYVADDRVVLYFFSLDTRRWMRTKYSFDLAICHMAFDQHLGQTMVVAFEKASFNEDAYSNTTDQIHIYRIPSSRPDSLRRIILTMIFKAIRKKKRLSTLEQNMMSNDLHSIEDRREPGRSTDNFTFVSLFSDDDVFLLDDDD